MALFDDEWIDTTAATLAALPAADGGDLVVDYVVSGAPGGKVTLGVTVDGGRVVRLERGGSPDPDVVLSMSHDTAVAILAGTLSPDAGYMNGAVKVEGAHARWLLDLRAVRATALAALVDAAPAG